MLASLETFITRAWYQSHSWLVLLRPLSALYVFISQKINAKKKSSAWKAPVPVVIVGNITVGGSGKTPIIIALADELKKKGYKPGVISRGYKSQAANYPFWVDENSDVEKSGDEPLLIAQRTKCPVVIGANRKENIELLLQRESCDVILSDDGLQHYQLQRDIEICVFDMQRGLGNRRCFPEGPLREPVERVKDVDLIVSNVIFSERNMFLESATNKNYKFKNSVNISSIKLQNIRPLNSASKDSPPQTKKVNAVAGISNPSRFFDSLKEQGFDVTEHVFADHHDFKTEDFQSFDQAPIVMTEKDAVKCRQLNLENAFYQAISVELSDDFYQEFFSLLDAKISNSEIK